MRQFTVVLKRLLCIITTQTTVKYDQPTDNDLGTTQTPRHKETQSLIRQFTIVLKRLLCIITSWTTVKYDQPTDNDLGTTQTPGHKETQSLMRQFTVVLKNVSMHYYDLDYRKIIWTTLQRFTSHKNTKARRNAKFDAPTYGSLNKATMHYYYLDYRKYYHPTTHKHSTIF